MRRFRVVRMKRWFQSRLFLLGLVPLVFLAWSWWDSESSSAGFGWSSPKGTSGLVTVQGRICLVAASVFPAPKLTFEGFHRTKFRVVGRPRSWSAVSYRENIEYKEISVAFWAVILLYTGCWIGALLWWQRWKRRKAAG